MEVREGARVCASCSFEIWEYDQNVSKLKTVTMRRISGTNHNYIRTLYIAGKEGVSCGGYMLLAVSVPIAIIPVIGWMLAPMLIILGCVSIVSPVRGAMLIDRIGDRFGWTDGYKEKKLIAAVCAKNTYAVPACPSCGQKVMSNVEMVYFPTDNTGTLDCESCGSTNHRCEDVLLHVPYPEVHGGDGLEGFLCSS